MMRIGVTQLYYDPLANGILDLQELCKTDAISRSKTEVLHRILTHYLRLILCGFTYRLTT